MLFRSVNGKPIPTSRADALERQMARAGQPVTDAQRQQIRDELVMREIFVQEAERRGLTASQDYQDQMALTRQMVLIRALLNDFQTIRSKTESSASMFSIACTLKLQNSTVPSSMAINTSVVLEWASEELQHGFLEHL